MTLAECLAIPVAFAFLYFVYVTRKVHFWRKAQDGTQAEGSGRTLEIVMYHDRVDAERINNIRELRGNGYGDVKIRPPKEER